MNVSMYQDGVYTHNVNKLLTLVTTSDIDACICESEFDTSTLTLHVFVTTVNIHCNVLIFGRIVMSLFPRIRIISAFIAFSSQQPVGMWRDVQVIPSYDSLPDIVED